MKVLHTSDWHLGRSLYGKSRNIEFEKFLQWLLEQIQTLSIDVLLVAGDIFDTGSPSNWAQELYYSFLCKLVGTTCRHVVIIAGNHDSASFLNAPKELLLALNIHVLGCAAPDPQEEVLVLRDSSHNPELIVCAVPYLRERDIRMVEPGESWEDKEKKQRAGICAHYSAVAQIAEEKRRALGQNQLPIIAMGHLFTVGAKATSDDGVRELYVGSLGHVDLECFPETFDYVALGHLHVPQMVGDREHIRYSGSPLPMGFGEARQNKSMCLLTFEGQKPSVQLVMVPVFKDLVRLKGDLAQILEEISKLKQAQSSAYLEIIIDNGLISEDSAVQIQEATKAGELEILKLKNEAKAEQVSRQVNTEALADLNEKEVFQRCMDANEVPPPQREELLRTYMELARSILECD